MLCCIRRAKPVEKNEDADLKIEQDANKPEDKAHKAATKIQASFRGHIIRKKLKDEKKEDSPPVQEGATEEEEKKEKASPVTESAAGNEPTIDSSVAMNEAKSPEKEKPVNSPTAAPAAAAAATSPTAASPTASEPRKDEAKPEEAAKAKENSKEAEEKLAPVSESKETTPAAKEDGAPDAPAESAASAKPAEPEEKEEPKQADVPATNNSETAPSKAHSQETESGLPEEKDAADESKPTESSAQVEAGNEEANANQDKV